MWTCKKCSESVDGTFNVCWNCGTSVDGVSDPEFTKDVEEVSISKYGEGTIEREIEERFHCGKCSHRTPSLKRISASGTGFSKLMDIQHNQFLVVSCANCGYSELFDVDILGAREGVGSILDFLFGG